MKTTKRIIKQVETEVVTKVICDFCKKEAKDWYMSLYVGSPYPECDGEEYQFCSHDCFIEHLKHMTVYDLTYIVSVNMNDILEEKEND